MKIILKELASFLNTARIVIASLLVFTANIRYDLEYFLQWELEEVSSLHFAINYSLAIFLILNFFVFLFKRDQIFSRNIFLFIVVTLLLIALASGV